MKKTNIKIWKLLTFMMVMCVAVLFNGNEAFAASDSVEFINVAKYGADGKGDATLITFNGKYYLVDTGVSAAYGEGTPLYNKLNNLANNDKYLSGIIITHCHTDHMGALRKIADSKVVKAGKTVLYLNKPHLRADVTATGLTNMKAWLNDSNFTKKFKSIERIAANTKVEVAASGGYGLYIYGSTLSYKEIKTKENENDASMVVQLKSKDLNALILGDLLLGQKTGGGVRGLINSKYGNEIIGINYEVCKVGHHGKRKSDQRVAIECKEFYNFINSKYYMFTIIKENATESFVTELKKRGSVRYSEKSHTFPKN